MKLIVAIVQPEKLEAVQGALVNREACVLSVGSVEDQSWLIGTYRGAEHRIKRHKIRLEVVIEDSQAEAALEDAIRASCAAGQGDSDDRFVVITCSECFIYNQERSRTPRVPEPAPARVQSSKPLTTNRLCATQFAS